MSSLQAALKALKKNKIVDIKKAIVELGDGQKPIPCIPTGSVVLDYLIGGYRTESGEKRCPGIPRGRISEVFGPEGSGKCLVAGTYVQSEYGMVTIEELFNLGGHELDGDKEEVVPHEVDLLNEYGEMETTSHLTWNGRQRVHRVTTEMGYGVDATGNHPVRVLDENGFIVWKLAGDINEGDYLVVMAGNVKAPGLTGITRAEAGYAGGMYGPFPETLVDLRNQMAGDLGVKTMTGSEIPAYVRMGSPEAQGAFLKGYTDQFLEKNEITGGWYIGSETSEFLRQFQLIALSLGHLCFLDKSKGRLVLGASFCKDYFGRTSAATGSAETIIPHMDAFLRGIQNSSQGYSAAATGILSNMFEGGVTRSALKDLLEEVSDAPDMATRMIVEYLQGILDMGYHFDKVTDTLVIENVPTYDVCLPTTHSFWSNGLVSHNTTIAIHTAIQCQKAGGTVCFLDFEHAFAPTYAADLGLDILDENFMLMQPRHWEEGAEIIRAMTMAGVDLIIVDSLAAMKPQRDIEENDVSSTGQVGHIARLQSSFLPKIVHLIEESGTSLVYINQLRSRIKTSMYDSGPSEETSGGRALKYYCSLRLSVKRIKSEYAQVENELTGNSEKQPISNIIRAKNVKNKVSKHQGHQAEFVIRYGEGIDNVRSVIDIAEARKVIKRSGAWYSFEDSTGNEAKAQGKEGLREYFIDNPADFRIMVDKVSSFTKPKAVISVSDDDIEVVDLEDYEDDD